MRGDQNGCSTCPAGEERFEEFTTEIAGRKVGAIQYDYRTTSGELFSKIAPTLEDARVLRDAWLRAERLERFAPGEPVDEHRETETTRAGVLHLATVIGNGRPGLRGDAAYRAFLARCNGSGDVRGAAVFAIDELEEMVGN